MKSIQEALQDLEAEKAGLERIAKGSPKIDVHKQKPCCEEHYMLGSRIVNGNRADRRDAQRKWRKVRCGCDGECWVCVGVREHVPDRSGASLVTAAS